MAPEFQAVQECNVVLVSVVKLSITSIAGDLYGEGLITEDVHDAMSLDSSTPQVKAGKLVDCVRTLVKIQPARVHDFIAVLRRHSGEVAAKALEDKIPECVQPAAAGSLALDPAVQEDLECQLELNLEDIRKLYSSYVSYIYNSIKKMNVSVDELCIYLFNLPALDCDKSKDEQQYKLLSGVRNELQKASTVKDIFCVLSTECASFLNYGIFHSIQNKYKITDSRELKYPEDLKAYINMHKVSEFVKINPELAKFTAASEMVILKFDIPMTSKIDKVLHLKKAVARILGLTPSALRLLSIKEGCVEATFLIPNNVADYIFKKVTPRQREEFQALRVMWLKCGDHKFCFVRETWIKRKDGSQGSGAIISEGASPAAGRHQGTGVPQEFSDSMSPDQLYSWLLSNQLPENDCKIIKDKGITGIAFKFLPEAEWRKYGISNVDLLLHFQQKVSPNETTHMDISGSKVSSGASKFPGRTLIEDHHWGTLCEQLRPCAAKWDDIAKGLKFKGSEINNIRADPTRLVNSPGSYLDAVLATWPCWAPGDKRGTEDYATLEALKRSVDSAGFGKIAEKLTLET